MLNSKKEFNELFERLRKVENRDIEQEKDIKYLTTIVKEFKNIFEKHDQNEMEKYSQTDKHIQEVNNNITIMNENIKDMNKNIEAQSKTITKIIENHEAHKEQTEKRLNNQDAKINKILGGFILASVVLGLGWQIYTYNQEKVKEIEEKRVKEKKELQEKIERLQSYTDRNKGSLDVVLKGKQ